MNQATHTGIRESIRRRIVDGEWALGEQMPGEVEFAREYGCARTTVNRALRTLAEEGIIERKRKGGTRVRPLPLPQAQLTIPILREQVESTGRSHTHQIISRDIKIPPDTIQDRLKLRSGSDAAYLETLHLADGKPFALERRWVNLDVVPAIKSADLSEICANEWLVRTVPFSRGEVSVHATSADAALSAALDTAEGTALFTLERTTWLDAQAVTAVTFYYGDGYRLEFSI